MPTYALAYATLPCMGCGKSSVLALDPELYARWQGGEHVQDVWPDWTPGQRELLITGTHPECWAEMFPPDEEDLTLVGPITVEWPDDIWNEEDR